MKINWFKINVADIFSLIENIIGIQEQIHRYFDELNNYLKQGFWCKDCGDAFDDCKCNEWDDLTDYEIKEQVMNFIIHNVSLNLTNEIKILINDLNNWHDATENNNEQIYDLIRIFKL